MRFCLLHHVNWAGHADHYDLMLQYREGGAGDHVLQTWATLRDAFYPDAPIPLRPLKDHRKEYLTYDGPVSGARGHVLRMDEGALSWTSLPVENDKTEQTFRLDGRICSGIFSIAKAADGTWLFQKLNQFGK